MVFFPNKQVELWEYTETSEYDIYGEPIVTYSKVGTYDADVQVKSNSETYKDFGQILEDHYEIFFNLNVPLTNSMILKFDNQTYEIIGSVMVYDHILKYKKVDVQKQRKPTTLTEQVNDGDVSE